MINLKNDSLCAGAVSVVKLLQSSGFIAFFAGGCVRDMLMNRVPKDFDIATNAVPDKVMSFFPKSIHVGKAFGVVRVFNLGHEYEVATFRRDNSYSDGRRPDSVTFSDPETDAFRRDFTMNALFFDPVSGQLHDFVGGCGDINQKMIRAVGDPEARFNEDHLRLIRAVRFECRLGFTIEPNTCAAISRNAALISKVSSERIQQELTRILLESPRAGCAVDRLSICGLLPEILPEVEAMKGQEQPPEFHPEGDVYTHTIMMLDAMNNPSARLAYAVLLHDVGKPATAKNVDGRIRFNNHAKLGEEMTANIMRRLRMSSDDIKAVSFCVGNHMRFMDVQKMRRSTLARLVGAATFPVELELHKLDCEASHGALDNYRFLRKFQDERKSAPVLPKPLVTGRDIIAAGVLEGPEIGVWKRRVYDAQLEYGFTDKEGAMSWFMSKWSP